MEMGICDLRNSVFTDEWGWEEERGRRLFFPVKRKMCVVPILFH